MRINQVTPMLNKNEPKLNETILKDLFVKWSLKSTCYALASIVRVKKSISN